MSIIKKIKGMFGNTLYYPGCLTKFAAPGIEENYRLILKEMRINFIETPEFYCCGSPVLNAGYEKEFKELVLKSESVFEKYGITKIITSCPSCYFIFKKHYPGLEVEHITITILKHMDRLNIKKVDGEQICYHDPCHLGRHSKIYEQPRKILEKIGYRVVEMQKSKEKSMCCGAGGGLRSNNKDLAGKIAKERLKQCPAKKLVTPCGLCYLHMKENADDIEVFEFSEVLRK